MRWKDTEEREKYLNEVNTRPSIKDRGVYIPSCLCIISRYPFLKTFTSILQSINDNYKSYLEFPLESYIETLICRIPLPPRGFYQVSLQLGRCLSNINIEQPSLNKLPLLDVDFTLLPKQLSLENIIKILCTMLLERNLLFVCDDESMITPIAESIICLMFPFDQQLVYIPVLPCNMIDFLGSPVPYIVGIHNSLFESAIDIISGGTCIVNINEDAVYYKEKGEDEDDIEELAELPRHEIDKVIKALSDSWYIFG